MPTPVKIHYIAEFLDEFDPDETKDLVLGYSKGYKIKFTGKCLSKVYENHRSAEQNPEAIEKYLEKEKSAGRVVGPFEKPPFQDFMLYPMAAVPKTTVGDFRILANLSFPEGQSVNAGIDRMYCTVQYATIHDAIKFMKSQKGKIVYLAKTDIEKAFRIVPIAPESYHLLLFVWKNEFYIDRSLPMGLSQSCNIFERLSRALEHIAVRKLKATHVTHLLDDFLFCATSKEKCLLDLENFVEFCTLVGVPIAKHKTVGPDTSIQFLGLTLDSVLGQCRLPIEKVQKCLTLLEEVAQKKKTTLKQLQSLIGYLNFCCCVVLPGRSFIRRLIDATRGVTRPSHHIRIDAGMRADLVIWKEFVGNYNGVTFFREEQWISSNQLALYTDSSKLGFGAICGTKWTFGEWPALWKHYHITILEFYPILAAVYIWGHEWQNRSILFYSDNIAVVSILNNQTSKEPNVMALLRLLVLKCLSLNIDFRSKHVPGKQNSISDSLSRFQFQTFRQLAPWAEKTPQIVPEEISPRHLGKLAKS